MSEPQDLEVTLEIAEAMVAEFESYLLDESLYRQLVVKTSAGDRTPKMSAGTLLETLRDLAYADEAGRLTSEQVHRLTELKSTFEELSRRYPQAYRQKLVRELKSQLDSWRWFLQDCRDDRSRCHDEYPFEVRIRNRIALLVEVLGDDVPAEQLARLQALDRDLKEVFVSGPFIWDRSLQDRYPEDRYWWLYGRPQ